MATSSTVHVAAGPLHDLCKRHLRTIYGFRAGDTRYWVIVGQKSLRLQRVVNEVTIITQRDNRASSQTRSSVGRFLQAGLPFSIGGRQTEPVKPGSVKTSNGTIMPEVL